jgi:hypothetical protein
MALLSSSFQRSREKQIKRLTAKGANEIAAAQIAWAAFPLLDARRPRTDAFAEAVEADSHEYLRTARNHDHESARRLAVAALDRWARLAEHSDEQLYAAVFGPLSVGSLPPKGMA